TAAAPLRLWCLDLVGRLAQWRRTSLCGEQVPGANAARVRFRVRFAMGDCIQRFYLQYDPIRPRRDFRGPALRWLHFARRNDALSSTERLESDLLANPDRQYGIATR